MNEPYLYSKVDAMHERAKSSPNCPKCGSEHIWFEERNGEYVNACHYCGHEEKVGGEEDVH